jgi:hypothetical protein
LLPQSTRAEYVLKGETQGETPSDEARDDKGENDTQRREGEGESGSSPEDIDCAGDQYPDNRE